MLVSVIVPVYNREKYLSDCLESILSQTLSDIEVVVIDDGSTDASLNIIRKFSEFDNRLKVITQKHSGASCARNTGIANSTGEYIMFVDSDDTIEPDYIEKIYRKAKSLDCDLVVCSDKPIDLYNKNGCSFGLAPSELFLKNDFLQKNPDIRFPNDVIVGEDTFFSFFILNRAKTLGFHFTDSYKYRQHEGQISNYVYNNYYQMESQIVKHINYVNEHILGHESDEKLYQNLSVFLSNALNWNMYKNKKNKNAKKRDLLYLKNYFNKELKDKINKETYLKLDYKFRLLVESQNYFIFTIKSFLHSKFNRLVALLKEFVN